MIQRISQMRKRQSEGGFTLIELLVVIIILGILSSVVVFAVRGTGDKGKVSAVKIDARTIKTAQESFCAKTGSFGTADELTGATTAPDGNTYKFLSEKPTLNDVVLTGGNQCGTDPLRSGYVLTSGPVTTNTQPFIFGAAFNNPTTLNPAVTTAGTIQPASAPVFNGLTGLASNATAIPELAESWKITNGGATYKFILRPGVVWSDNTAANPQPLLAEDVKFSYEAALLIWHARTSSSVRSALKPPPATALIPNPPPCTDPGTNQARRLKCDGIVANESDLSEPTQPQTDPPTYKKTVTFNFTRPYGPLLQQATLTDGAIIPSHLWPACTTGYLGTATNTDLSCPRPTGSADKSWPGAGPVGTGPFKVNAAASGGPNEVVYDKNTQYWRGSSIPYFNQMKSTSVGADLAGLQGGAIDYLPGVTGGVVGANTAKADSSLVTDTGNLAPGGSSNCTRTVMFNLWANGQTPAQIKAKTATADAILGDPAPGADPVGYPDGNGLTKGLLVRRAIAMSLAREPNNGGAGNAGYASLANSLGAKMANSPTNSGMVVGYTPAPLPAYDKAKAEAFLNAAGRTIPTGGGPRFSLGYTSLGSDDPVSVKIRGDMAAVGINVVKNPPASTSFAASPSVANNFFDTFNGVARDFDVLLVSSCQGTDPEMGTRRVYHGDAISPVPFSNGSGYFNETVDGWFNDARASLDVGVRNGFYKKINDQVAIDLPTLWLTETVSTRAWKATCSGFRPWTGAYAEFGSCLR